MKIIAYIDNKMVLDLWLKIISTRDYLNVWHSYISVFQKHKNKVTLKDLSFYKWVYLLDKRQCKEFYEELIKTREELNNKGYV